jgi:uncharacterized protein (DUF58 family)
MTFKDSEIFEGESTEITEVVKNNKIIPMRWFSIEMPISRFMIFTEEEKLKARTKETIKKDYYTLLSYEKVTKKKKITILKRGIYKIDEFTVASGDLFSRYKFLENRTYEAKLSVYPRLISIPEFKLFLNKLTGEILTKRHVIEDPFILRGIRDYTFNDSPKTINWMATAKSGEMKVNQYDFTASHELLILLNTERFNSWDNNVLIEESIRLAATISCEFIEKGIQVSLISNGLNTLTKEEINIKGKGGKLQISAILETLASMDEKYALRSMSEIIEEETMKSRRDYTIILISYYHGKDLYNMVREALNMGVQIKWLIPKLVNDNLRIEPSENITFWEVSEDERTIY